MKEYRSVFLSLIAVALAWVVAGGGWKAIAFQAKRGEQSKVWVQVDESSIETKAERATLPLKYKTYRLNKDALDALLSAAPMEFTDAALNNPVEMLLPMPDGKLARFRAVESPIMLPELAAKHPETRTYRGQGVDDPTATTRFGFTLFGFHAIVLSAGGTVYIDPHSKGDTAHYISYYKSDYRKDVEPFRCYVTEADSRPTEGRDLAPLVNTGDTLHTFRLGMSATGEYTNFFRQPGDTELQARLRAEAAIDITINRVNAIFERECSIHLNLSLVFAFTNPATDPYTDGNLPEMNDENEDFWETYEDQEDIAHVLGGIGSGGLARVGVVCFEDDPHLDKARGASSTPSPSGNAFDVDIVTHEMGHQFGATHTFNGTTAFCGGDQRTGGSAYEPGSGSTIMSYGNGTCGLQSLQLAKNDYFHIKNLEQIAAYIADDGDCDVQTATGNNPPVAFAGVNWTIPKNTPFILTAGATDADGDLLAFCWEEYDLGPSSPPDNDADGNERPIFRSFPPTLDASRTFPSPQYIRDNANQPPMTYECGTDGGGNPIPCFTGEILPSIGRDMMFRVTVRDNRAGGGGVSSSFMQVAVTATAGPFLVTQPDAPATWSAVLPQTVTWDVAGTNVAPVNATHVSIFLSTDGGNNFPITLASNTLNDGTETIVLPNITTSTARIKVQSGIFFDISNTNFTIQSGATVVTNTNDGGAGSLRHLIQVAELTEGASSIISFNIPGAGVHTINLSAPLPEIKEPTTIDGITQPGYAGAPLIELNGASAGMGASGLVISAGGSTIRGLVINRFEGAGIVLTTNDANMIIGNYIGTDSTGNADLGNGFAGILIDGSSGNQIRSEIGGLSNVISGNGTASFLADGITITGNSTGNIIRGNLIGTNAAGTAIIGNSRDGVRIDDTSNNNIGGTALGGRNIISGNERYGVNIEGAGATGNIVLGNYIGTDAAGAADLGNRLNGVVINQACNNTVGGVTAAAGNVISGNGSNPCCPGAGIVLVLADGNLVQGNFIGTNAAGTAVVSNFGPGIDIANAANNIIGGTTTAARNLISGNGRGIFITGTTSTGNLVQGNFIGTDATGAGDLGNSGEGVLIRTDADNNTVGGLTSTPGAPPGNVISGNGGSGVSLSDFDSTGNTVQGNLIGLRADGNTALRNDQNGVTISNSPGNLIGGLQATARNVISGNTLNSSADGVDIIGESSDNNTVAGNYIGVDIDGDTFIGNGGNGVMIQLGADNNTVGGVTAGERNVISANNSDGVEITGSGTTGNLLFGNYIGVRADGVNPMFNNGNGVLIASSASSNSIGGTAAGAGNTIAFNNGDAIFISSATSISNSILSNSIHSNTGLGIDLNPNGVTANDAGDADAGANRLQNFPVLTSATTAGGATIIQGTLNSSPNTSFRVEFFSNAACDPAGSGEGQIFIGFATVPTDASGNASFTATLSVTLQSTNVITATATNALNDTSEFSQCRAICSYALSAAGRFFAASGGNDSISVVAAAGCNWAAATGESWIMIVSEATGSGDGAIDFVVRENFASSARAGTITAGGAALTIVQAGASAGDCSFSISPPFQTFEAAGGTGAISLTTGSDCAWQSMTNDSWISITSISVGIGSATITYSVATNPGPDGRTGKINIAGRILPIKQKRP